jgi:hypothetical protein
MTDTTLPGMTNWERHQYLKDHGRRADTVAEYRAFAAFLEADEDTPLPPDGEPIVAAAKSEDAVDRWAARHHVAPEWRQGTYRAAFRFGKVLTFCLVFVPKDVLDERLDSQDATEMAGAAA